MKKINFNKTATAAEIMEALSTAYAMLFWDKSGKRFEFVLREADQIGTPVNFGAFGPTIEPEEELTYAEIWEREQKFDNKRERAYLEPAYSGDVAGNEVPQNVKRSIKFDLIDAAEIIESNSKIKQVREDDYNGSAD